MIQLMKSLRLLLHTVSISGIKQKTNHFTDILNSEGNLIVNNEDNNIANELNSFLFADVGSNIENSINENRFEKLDWNSINCHINNYIFLTPIIQLELQIYLMKIKHLTSHITK